MLYLEKQPILLPKEFSGSAQQELFQRYGDPRIKGWGNKWMLIWKVQKNFEWFPVYKMCVHKDFQPRLYNAFTQLQSLGLHSEIKSVDEVFGIRFVSGSDVILSTHSWGAAIDMNADENPVGGVGSWSEAFIEVMSQNGIHCGQKWNGRTDPMHFSMVNG